MHQPGQLPDRLPVAPDATPVPGGAVRRLGPDRVPAMLALYDARVRWLAAAGIDQWRPDERPAVAARLSEQARAGGLFGIVDGAGVLHAAGALCTHSALWDGMPPRHHDGVWYLEKLVSASPGAGAALLAALEAAAVEQGVGTLRMDCLASSLPLRRFWQSRGYLPVGRAERPDGPGLLRHEKRLLPLPDVDLAVRALAPDILDRSFPGAQRATLLFVVRGGRILLIHKRRGHGAGKINGPGGKLDPGETPRQCAVREVREELGIDVRAPRYAGELRFQETDGSRIHGYVFRAGAYRGTPVTTPEAIPHWCALDAIPYRRMWDDDRMWLPWLLAGEPFRAAFLTHGDRIEQAQLHLGALEEPADPESPGEESA